MEINCAAMWQMGSFVTSGVVYISGIQPGVRVPPGVSEDILGVRRSYTMYNLHYVPTTLGVQSWREIISGGTRTKKVEYTDLDELQLERKAEKLVTKIHLKNVVSNPVTYLFKINSFMKLSSIYLTVCFPYNKGWKNWLFSVEFCCGGHIIGDNSDAKFQNTTPSVTQFLLEATLLSLSIEALIFLCSECSVTMLKSFFRKTIWIITWQFRKVFVIVSDKWQAL
jgi:hypothetical protein